MKLLKELTADYSAKDIADLVDFIIDAPISLPEDQRYRFEKVGSVVHIFGYSQRIVSPKHLYDDAAVTTSSSGLEIAVNRRAVKRVVIHSMPYSGEALPSDALYSGVRGERVISESASSESRSSESRSSGESRRRKSVPSESRSSGESRRRDYSGESRGREYSGESRGNGGSRGGESR
jgi:hypothetical protein